MGPVVDLPPLPTVSPIRPLTAHPPTPPPRCRHRSPLARGSAAPAGQDNGRGGWRRRGRGEVVGSRRRERRGCGGVGARVRWPRWRKLREVAVAQGPWLYGHGRRELVERAAALGSLSRCARPGRLGADKDGGKAEASR
ncbi:unnamed protein product [Urochloa humidicola]